MFALRQVLISACGCSKSLLINAIISMHPPKCLRTRQQQWRTSALGATKGDKSAGGRKRRRAQIVHIHDSRKLWPYVFDVNYGARCLLQLICGSVP